MTLIFKKPLAEPRPLRAAKVVDFKSQLETSSDTADRSLHPRCYLIPVALRGKNRRKARNEQRQSFAAFTLGGAS